MTTDQKPLHIVSLEVHNVKRIRALRIRPNGSTVLIGGRNEQGKSSCLDAIEMALGGAKSIPLEPVRHGARKGEIDVALGDIATQEVEFKIERSLTSKGPTLVVRGKDGIELPSPQKLLDTLFARMTFDPFAFSRMDKDDQSVLLKKLVGLDFTDLEAARAKAYAERTEVNKEVKRLQAVIKSGEFYPEAPKQPVNVAALTEKLQVHRNAVGSRNTLKALIDQDRAKLGFIDEQIAKLERELAEAKIRREQQVKVIAAAEEALPPEPAPVDDVQHQLSTAEATNAKVRANAERMKLEKELDAKITEAEDLSGAIASIDAEKAELLAKAKFPVDGLSFDDDGAGPMLNDVPLAQASQAAKLRLSVAIGAALNPRIKVMLIREGAFLDDNSLQLLSELAEQHGCQCWVERVGTGDKAAIIIEDGEIVEPAEAHAGAA
jgi:hypothetical protein